MHSHKKGSSGGRSELHLAWCRDACDLALRGLEGAVGLWEESLKRWGLVERKKGTSRVVESSPCVVPVPECTHICASQARQLTNENKAHNKAPTLKLLVLSLPETACGSAARIASRVVDVNRGLAWF